jgi:transposase
MSNQQLQSPSFGAIDRPMCPHCGERAHLTRRSPHPDYGLRYEQQLFICSACDHTIERIVDASGDPLE